MTHLRPRQCNAAKGRDVHLGIDLCRRRLPVTQQLTNLAQGRAAAKQIGGKGVPQQVRPFELGVQPGALGARAERCNRWRPGRQDPAAEPSSG